MKALIWIGLALVLNACDTVPIVASTVEWKSSKPDQDCIRKAIEATKGIQFVRQEAREVGKDCVAITGECDKRLYETYYDVEENKGHAHVAVVRLTETRSGKMRSLDNRAVGGFGTKFSDSERAGFEKAIRNLNQSIQKFCAAAGSASDPK